jgi:magnesium chelatase family protein
VTARVRSQHERFAVGKKEALFGMMRVAWHVRLIPERAEIAMGGQSAPNFPLASCPFRDRIDLHVDVQAVSAADLVLPPPAEGSREVAARVAAARDRQTARYSGEPVRTNAEADGVLLDRVATPDEPGRKLLAQAAEAMRLSARGYHRVLRVARTIADLTGSETVGRIHIAEALSYRRRAPTN